MKFWTVHYSRGDARDPSCEVRRSRYLFMTSDPARVSCTDCKAKLAELLPIQEPIDFDTCEPA